jgi:hypothetical protein
MLYKFEDTVTGEIIVVEGDATWSAVAFAQAQSPNFKLISEQKEA